MDVRRKILPDFHLDTAMKLARFGVCVMREYVAVSLIKKKIHERDTLVEELCRNNGSPLPDWVGRDHVE
jgi:hypothetical protein